jgi:hypothetical protein
VRRRDLLVPVLNPVQVLDQMGPLPGGIPQEPGDLGLGVGVDLAALRCGPGSAVALAGVLESTDFAGFGGSIVVAHTGQS